jgi:hypothetical protein
MKLHDYFKTLLEDTVNLKPSKLQNLDDRVPTITEAIKGSTRGTTVLDAIPQGSWAHRTIIEPGKDLEFDADFLLQLDEVTNWAPCDYSDVIWDVLSNHGTYGSMTKRKNRCIRVTYANDCHVDVVPYVVLDGGREVIINRTTGAFEDTNPIGFTEWLQEKDMITGGDLRKVIRLMKYLRDHRGRFDIKSILLTTVIGQRVAAWQPVIDKTYYADVPTTLMHVINDLDTWLQSNWIKPSISDPSCPNTSFDHRWTDKQYETFRTKIHTLAADISAAYNEADKNTSVALWQDIFGPAFRAPTTTALVAAALTKSVSNGGIAREARVNGEDFIDDWYPLDLRYDLRVDCEVSEPEMYNRRQRRAALRSRAHSVPPGRKLSFRATTNTPGPYEIKWKVRNRGFEAKNRNAERGSIFGNADVATHEEPTAFKGPHYVECYVVKDGNCVAAAHVPVNILFNS